MYIIFQNQNNMSIATLKRKTMTQYRNMSVDSPNGFSINGTHRNQGFVGQTNLSRFTSRTTIRVNAPHTLGEPYTIGPVVMSGITSLEDSTVVKSSVLGTKGLIDTKYRWVRRGLPFMSVKPDNNLNMNTQQEYVEHKKKTTLVADCPKSNAILDYSGCNELPSKQKPNKGHVVPVCGETTKTDPTAMSYDKYMDILKKKCVNLDKIRFSTNTLSGMPINTCNGQNS
jgi:hypothetical protein